MKILVLISLLMSTSVFAKVSDADKALLEKLLERTPAMVASPYGNLNAFVIKRAGEKSLFLVDAKPLQGKEIALDQLKVQKPVGKLNVAFNRPKFFTPEMISIDSPFALVVISDPTSYFGKEAIDSPYKALNNDPKEKMHFLSYDSKEAVLNTKIEVSEKDKVEIIIIGSADLKQGNENLPLAKEPFGIFTASVIDPSKKDGNYSKFTAVNSAKIKNGSIAEITGQKGTLVLMLNDSKTSDNKGSYAVLVNVKNP